MMKKNTLLELTIDDMNNLGNGVAHTDGFAVFVPGGVTGDRIAGKVIKVTKNYAVARIEEILSPSPYRTEERSCPYHKRCGGCIYRNITREYELEIKRNTVLSALRRAGITDISAERTVTDGVADRYRNKAQYPLSRDRDGNISIGFFSQKSHDVIDLEDCQQLPESFTRISLLFKEYIKDNKISVYDEISGTGLVRHLYLRTAMSGSILMCIVINGVSLPNEDSLVKFFRDKEPRICGISVNSNRKNTNVILGDSYRLLWGEEYLEDVMCSLTLRLSPASFYQVNRSVAEKLYSLAADKAGLSGEETLLDLFCGAGTIGLSMAHRVKRLFGVDIVPDAIENARYNAERNGITNAQFAVADAADGEGLFAAARKALGDDFYASVIVLDPPRKGCSRELLSAVAEHSPQRIVYISCNPDTLARDIVILRELGYDTDTVTPVDMFPGTGHVESVVCLSREKAVHEMNLNPSPFEKIKSGQKTIELRLYDEKRQRIKEGDVIAFTNTSNGEKMRATVKTLHRFDSFEELYKTLPLLQCGYTVDDVDTAHPSDMEQYYSAKEQKKYGVVGIELFPPKRMTDESVVCLTKR